MKLYIFSYTSYNNLFNGEIVFKASSIADAQDKFFSWVKMQPVYPHMWRLSFQAREVDCES